MDIKTKKVLAELVNANLSLMSAMIDMTDVQDDELRAKTIASLKEGLQALKNASGVIKNDG